jgi:V/A-type H+-transporting ATPase subunit A
MDGTIKKISGPLVIAKDVQNAHLFDVVKVGDTKLTGEIIEMRGELVWIQVYEDTSGLQVNEPVISTGEPLSLTLGPGVLNNIYDGILRPLTEIGKLTGIYITKGIDVPSLDNEKKWDFNATVQVGDNVIAGDIIGTVQETSSIENRITIPYSLSGEILTIDSGKFTIEEEIAQVKGSDGEIHSIKLAHKWPIRVPRPVKEKVLPTKPLITGTRVLDTFFPIAKGGVAAIPGPFGSGKSVTQQQIAKWCDAQIIIYIGCGERGNEMTDVLKEFPELVDGNTGNPLMERTVLIANTSNMPIAAREASVYTGMTLAEYYRDMGYDVALMADSTSRWAEAMREMSGRLEEMPSEGGYPAYLNTRIAQFYERAGNVVNLGTNESRGSVSVIGAISPPGGDLSEPVSQNTLGIAKVFWGLDANLASARHYPAINWLTSYSQYFESIAKPYFDSLFGSKFSESIYKATKILKEEEQLLETIKIVGTDSLSKSDRIVLKCAEILREDFLQQFAFDPIDTYTSLEKQQLMLNAIIDFKEQADNTLTQNEMINIDKLLSIDAISYLARMKNAPEDEMEKYFKKYYDGLENNLNEVSELDELED